MGRRRDRPWRRWTLRSAAALALAALAQTAIVAAAAFGWPPAFFGDTPELRYYTLLHERDGMFWCHFVTVAERLPRTRVLSIRNPTEDAARHVERRFVAAPITPMGRWTTDGGFQAPDHLPHWVDLDRFDEDLRLETRIGELRLPSFETTAIGWPWRVLRGELIDSHVEHWDPAEIETPPIMFHETETRGLLTLSDVQPDLPYLPVWRGIVLNLLAFALPVVGLQWFAGAYRSAHRRRRGRCTACAYDLTGIEPTAPCPECGRPTPVLAA